MVPVCEPMAQRWQMKFASSRGYGSLTLQHDVARAILHRRAQHRGQYIVVFFISDHDPSGFDLQRAWEEALANLGVAVVFRRIALTLDQIRDADLDIERLSIEVKPSDSRSEAYIGQYGDRCWEADILPASIIECDLDRQIGIWLDLKLWKRRGAEIERARKLL
jgi:hypothetical protein